MTEYHLAVLTAALVALFLVATIAMGHAQSTTTVTPNFMGGWTAHTSGGFGGQSSTSTATPNFMGGYTIHTQPSGFNFHPAPVFGAPSMHIPNAFNGN